MKLHDIRNYKLSEHVLYYTRVYVFMCAMYIIVLYSYYYIHNKYKSHTHTYTHRLTKLEHVQLFELERFDDCDSHAI